MQVNQVFIQSKVSVDLNLPSYWDMGLERWEMNL